jgi:hypothetical protein
MDFKDLNLSRVELNPIGDSPSAGFSMSIMVSRGEGKFSPQKFELSTAQGLLFRAIIQEIADLRSKLEGKKPAAAVKKSRAA